MTTFSVWRERLGRPLRRFDAWMHELVAEEDAEEAAALVDMGWLEADAIAFFANKPKGACDGRNGPDRTAGLRRSLISRTCIDCL
jgi:hypothetical protein